MQLRDEIIIREAKRPGIEITIPDEGDDILVLRLKGNLTPTIAVVLQCDYLYDQNGNPHDGFKDTNLDTVLNDMDLRLIGGDKQEINNFFPESIFGFRIYRSGENALSIQFKAKTTGRLQEILDFFRANRGDGFTISIRPRQGELFEGGTRVAASEGSTGDAIGEVVDSVLEGIASATEADGEAGQGPVAPEAEEAAPPLAPRPRRKRGRVHQEQAPPPADDAAPWEEPPAE